MAIINDVSNEAHSWLPHWLATTQFSLGDKDLFGVCSCELASSTCIETKGDHKVPFMHMFCYESPAGCKNNV